MCDLIKKRKIKPKLPLSLLVAEINEPGFFDLFLERECFYVY
ncbi:hypothetical protein KP509_1Z190900 [Ceratopteris richardii]|nr:hypothetical protein KP509_1Z190900 [Ceratopteris richardii]